MIEDSYGRIAMQYADVEMTLSFRVKNPHKIIIGEYRLMHRLLPDGKRDLDNEHCLDIDLFIQYTKELLSYANNEPYGEKTKFNIIDRVCERLISVHGHISIYTLDVYIDVLMSLIFCIEMNLFDAEFTDNYPREFARLTDYCLAKYIVVANATDRAGYIRINPIYKNSGYNI